MIRLKLTDKIRILIRKLNQMVKAKVITDNEAEEILSNAIKKAIKH